MKLISWNVNGLRACMGKGFLEVLDRESPDVICLQETKMQREQADLAEPGAVQVGVVLPVSFQLWPSLGSVCVPASPQREQVRLTEPETVQMPHSHPSGRAKSKYTTGPCCTSGWLG